MAQGVDCMSKLMMMLIVHEAMFHMIHEGHHLSLTPSSQHKTKGVHGAYSGGAVVEQGGGLIWNVPVCLAGRAEVQGLQGGPFEKEMKEHF